MPAPIQLGYRVVETLSDPRDLLSERAHAGTCAIGFHYASRSQVVYRQLLQLDRALSGRPQPLEARLLGTDHGMATSMTPTPVTTASADNPRALSTVARRDARSELDRLVDQRGKAFFDR